MISSCAAEPRERAWVNPSPISTPLIAWMDISAAASRASSLRSQWTWLPSPGGTPYASTSTTPPRVSASFLAASTSATIAALASGSRQRSGSASTRAASSGCGTRPGLTSTLPRAATRETIRTPSPCSSSARAPVPSATRAAVSRALARSSTGRASRQPYFCIPARSACPGRGRVSGALRASPSSSPGSTGSAAMTCSHLGHSVLATCTATAPPMVRPWRTPPTNVTSSASNFMRAPRPYPRRRRANAAATSAVVTWTSAGSPSRIATSAGPCDSPAVSHLSMSRILPRPHRGVDIPPPYPVATRRDLDDHGHSLSTATAQRGRTMTLPPAAEFAGQCVHEPQPGPGERMPQGDGATVHVDHVHGQTQLVDAGGDHTGESLVDLEQVDVADSESSVFAPGPTATARLELRGGVRPRHFGAGHHPGQRSHAEAVGHVRRGEDPHRGSVAQLRGVPGGDRAVGAEGRTQLSQGVDAGLGPDPLIAAQRVEGDDLVSEPSAATGRCGTLLAARGDLVLHRPAHTEPGVGFLGELAHPLSGQPTPETVDDERVDQSHRCAVITAEQPRVSGPRHRIAAADHVDLALTEPDPPARLGHGRQPGQADVVHGDRRHRPGQPTGRCGQPCGVLAVPGLQHLA